MNEAAHEAPAARSENRALAWAAGIMALLGTAAVLLAAHAYAHGGGGLLSRLDVNVGEVLMEQGMRLEDGGNYDAAIARYRMALNARWEGRQNRGMTLKRLGTRLWLQGRPEAALPYLDEAAGMPEGPMTAHEPRVNALIKLERWEAAREAVETWRAACPDDIPVETEAAIAFYRGRIARELEGVEVARRFFEKGVELAPQSRNASELAYIMFNNEAYEQALHYLDLYLKGRATGPRADFARELRALAQKRLRQQRGP